MKVYQTLNRRGRKFCPNHARALEFLEPRVLLSASAGGAKSPLAQLPNEAALVSPKFSDEWYFQNTGQTISDALLGPSKGTAGADINATNAWDLTTGSKTVVIAVLDTGVDLANQDLAGNLWVNPGEIPNDRIDNDHNGFVDDVNGWNFLDGNNNIQDTVGHGTTVNSVIGAVGNNGIGVAGVAWNVQLLNVKVGDASGVADSNLIAGINYIIALKKAGVNIVAINASYIATGVPSFASFDAIRAAGDAGILYVAAAGNVPINWDMFIPSGFLPSNMIFVAASDANDNLASFSGYGANSVALAAPGVDIITTTPGGFTFDLSGTSYAAPMVTGTLALMKSLVPGATMNQLESALFNGADQVASLSGKTTYGRLDAYKALELLLADRAPTGHVDVLNNDTVVGWAFDANAGLKPVTVQLVIDGVVRATTTAVLGRPDLTAYVGSANHGFSFAMPALGGGLHTVQVRVLDFAPFMTALPGTLLPGGGNLSVASPPIGWIDAAAATRVVGWALDTDTPATSINIRVDVDGVSIGTFTANANRPDLVPLFGSANHGFSVALPTLSPTFHRIDIFGFDTTTGLPALIATRTVNGNIPATGFIDLFNGSTLAGWAVDPDAPATSIQIEYSIDGGALVTATASASRPDLVAIYGSANHGFVIALPQLTVGPHTVTVYAVDADNSALILLGTKTAAVANPAGRKLPTGVIDVSTNTLVQGWAYDPSSPLTSIQVRIDVDGVMGTPFFANGNRPDLVHVIGSANHGFGQILSQTPGEHTVAVVAIGVPSDEVVLLGTRLVGQGGSQGFLDVVNGSAVIGWAFNAAAGAAPVTVRLDIDGVAGPTVLANLSRPDLTPVIGSPNHGFSMSTPKLAAGTHRLDLLVLDPLTLQAVIVATQFLTIV